MSKRGRHGSAESSGRLLVPLRSKAFIEQADAVKQVCNERDILTMVDSPFIIRFFQSYRDAGHVYMRMEYAPGGHLFRPSGRTRMRPRGGA